MSKIESNIGDRFYRWTVIDVLGGIGGKSAVKVRCDCGKEKIMHLYVLKRGGSKSCGCFRREKISFCVRNRPHKHNLSKHPLFQVWRAMKSRCYNKNTAQYNDYGGRGILVCYEWINDFKRFYDWCITNGYQKGLQIDREDNNLGYNENNCRFVTPQKSMRNTRRNNIIEYNGVKKCITDWASDLGLTANGLSGRLKRWPLDKALSIKNIRNEVCT